MKINKSTFLKMQSDINSILPYYMVRKQVELKEITEALMHDIWFTVYANRVWNNKDIRLFRGEFNERVLSFNANYELYPCNTNDTTISTALNKIHKQILNA